MQKICLSLAAALLCAGGAQAQTAPDAAKIMAPPTPVVTSDAVVTIVARKKRTHSSIVDTGPGGPYINFNTQKMDAATDTSKMSGEQQGGFVDPSRQFMLGRLYIEAHDHSLDDAFAAYDAQDFPKALTLFKHAYEKMGFEQAGIMVARLYLFGQGTPRNTKEAIVWLKRVADSPHRRPAPSTYSDPDYFPPGAEAAVALGRIYASGFDVPVDAKEARHWYASADALGYFPATHVMGEIYRAGYGGSQNMSKAIDCYTRAAKAGYGPSQYALSEIYYSGDGMPADPKLALSWLQASAKSGEPDGLYAVGRIYELGLEGMAADPQKALVYYKEAAVKGQPEAEESIGRAFYFGNGLPKDPATARKWFLKAARDANPDAMFNLAVMLINGEGGDRDLVQAWAWLKVADAGGKPEAGKALTELEPKMTADERSHAQALFQPSARAHETAQ